MEITNVILGVNLECHPGQVIALVGMFLCYLFPLPLSTFMLPSSNVYFVPQVLRAVVSLPWLLCLKRSTIQSVATLQLVFATHFLFIYLSILFILSFTILFFVFLLHFSICFNF